MGVGWKKEVLLGRKVLTGRRECCYDGCWLEEKCVSGKMGDDCKKKTIRRECWWENGTKVK